MYVMHMHTYVTFPRFCGLFCLANVLVHMAYLINWSCFKWTCIVARCKLLAGP